MPSATKVLADRHNRPNSRNHLADGKDRQRDAVSKVHRKSREVRPSAGNQKSWGFEEVDDDGDTSDVDAIPAAHLSPATISFGALARAQASLTANGSKQREGENAVATSTHKLSTSARSQNSKSEPLNHGEGKSEDKPILRLSKHAPAEISSKNATSRKRSVVPVPKRDVRDPRFENALGAINEEKIKSNYAFLEDYRESEMKALKTELKKTKSESEKERLKKEIMRMESKKGARDRKAAEQEVLRRHRKEERSKIQMGKTPFYLKKAEVKREALLDKYGKMKAKEVDKLIVRRRKKRASREKKSTPRERRLGAS